MRDGWDTRSLDEVRDEIRRAIPVDVLLRQLGVLLVRAGQSFKFPHHGEKSASAHIYDTHWKCFGCGESGDIFDLYAEHCGGTHMDALRALADQAGIRIPEPSPQARERVEQQRRTRDLVGLVAEVAQKALWATSAEASLALTYLRHRGLTDQTIWNAQLGLLPAWRSAAAALEARGEGGLEAAAAAGIVREKRGGGSFYDALHHCIVFPVSKAGRVVTLRGRPLTAFTALDGRELPGLPENAPRDGEQPPPKTRALDASAAAAPPRASLYWAGPPPRDWVILVEGEPDTLTIAQADLPVAGLVGASTVDADVARQLDDRHHERVIYQIPDDDAAGRRAAGQVAAAFAERLRILQPWAELGLKDPNDVLKRYVREELAAAVPDDAAATSDEEALQAACVRASVRMRADVEAAMPSAPTWLDWELERLLEEHPDPVRAIDALRKVVFPVLVGLDALHQAAAVGRIEARAKARGITIGRRAIQTALKETAPPNNGSTGTDRTSGGGGGAGAPPGGPGGGSGGGDGGDGGPGGGSPTSSSNVALGGLEVVDGHYGLWKNDGSGADFKPMSNFVIEVEAALVFDDGAGRRLKGSLQLVNGRSWPVVLAARDLVDTRSLLGALPDPGAAWLGRSGHDLMKLRVTLDAVPVPEYAATSVLGRHVLKDGTQVLVLPDETWDRDGPREPRPLIWHSERPMAPAVDMTAAAEDDWFDDGRAVLSRVGGLYEPTALWRMLGWTCAVPFAPVIRRRLGRGTGFPILLLHGTRGGGKTSLLSILGRMAGWNRDPVSCRSTNFSWLWLFSSCNCFPVVLDEYKPTELNPRHLDDLHHKLRASYNGESELRGQRDQSVTTYQLIAPISVAGESHFQDAALVERCIVAVTDKGWLPTHPEAQVVYSQLQRMDLGAFAGGFHLWALRQDEGWIADRVRTWTADLRSGCQRTGVECQPRVLHNIAVMLTGLDVFALLCQELELGLPASFPTDLLAFGVAAVSDAFTTSRSVSPVERFLSDILIMAAMGASISQSFQIDSSAGAGGGGGSQRGSGGWASRVSGESGQKTVPAGGGDGAADGDGPEGGLLYLHLPTLHAAWAEWCRRRGWDARVVAVEELSRQLIEEAKKPKGTGFVVKYNHLKKFGGTARKAYVIDLAMARNLVPGLAEAVVTSATEENHEGT